MSLDLSLLVIEPVAVEYALATAVLPFPKNHKVNFQLEKLSASKWDTSITITGGWPTDAEGISVTLLTTPYGDPLTYMTAYDLLRALAHLELDHFLIDAAYEYLKRLPQHTKIVLYWN